MKNSFFNDRRASALLVLVLCAFLLVAGMLSSAEARISIWISSRDANSCIVSAVFQYDEKLEAQIRRDNGITNSILQIDIHTKDPAELCRMLVLGQGQETWMPLICVTGVRGNIYTGYLVLPDGFDLKREIEIRLGDRTVEAKFIQE